MFNLYLIQCCHLPCPLFSTEPIQVGHSLHLYTSGTGPWVSSHWTTCCREYLVIFYLLVFTLCVHIRFMYILGKVQPVLLDLIHFWGSHFGVSHFHLSSERLFFRRLAQLQHPSGRMIPGWPLGLSRGRETENGETSAFPEQL